MSLLALASYRSYLMIEIRIEEAAAVRGLLGINSNASSDYHFMYLNNDNKSV